MPTPHESPPTQINSPSVYHDVASDHDGYGDFVVTAPDFPLEEDVAYRLKRKAGDTEYDEGPIAPNEQRAIAGVLNISTFRIDATVDMEVRRTVSATTVGVPSSTP